MIYCHYFRVARSIHEKYTHMKVTHKAYIWVLYEECKSEWIKSTCYYHSIHSDFTASHKRIVHVVSWPALVCQSFMNIHRSRDRRGSVVTSCLESIGSRILPPLSASILHHETVGARCISVFRGLLSEFRLSWVSNMSSLRVALVLTG